MERVNTSFGFVELADERAAAVARQAAKMLPARAIEVVEIRNNGYKTTTPTDFGVSVGDPVIGVSNYLKRKQRPVRNIRFIKIK